ncbi:MAG: asparagine synthase (glutamine-hydrolyzing) [Pseudomonadota bacterium]
MCGITGYVGLSDENLLRAMCSSMIHRGPDDAGYYVAPGVGLAMRRLAIIDIKSGQQPIANETQDVWVVFNGEIYNFEELRAQLLKRGHSFKTHSDTETIVHLYEDYGLDFVRHLRGMFGIALWDAKQRQLVLVRDRIGEKPLYYAQQENRLFFGSEMKTILQALPTRTVEAQSVCDFLAAGYVAGSKTFYKEISRLQPGEMLVWRERSGCELKRYWRNDFSTTSNIAYRDAVVGLERELDEAIRLCLKSDVEVGAFLSGGIDSSLICALMKKHEAQVQTFSVGYRGNAAGFNELSHAQRVADHLGTQHHELILEAQSSMDLLPRIIWHYDEPHGEPTSVLVYLLCEFVRKRLKVALGGTGGDELFYGYPKHQGLRYLEYYRRLPKFVRTHLIERIAMKWPESTTGSRFAKRVKRFVAGAELPPEQAYLSWVSLLNSDVRASLVSEACRKLADDPAGDLFLRRYLMDAPASMNMLQRATSLDVEGYLPEYQLTYMDRMSMANSLEVRSPLCDYKLVEFATKLPGNYRLKGTRTKHILKDVAKKYLPQQIVERKKVGFDSPIGQWFKGELKGFIATFLAPEQINRSGLLDGAAVQRVIADHMGGARDYSLQLWSIIALEVWYRMYIEDRVTDGNSYRLSDLRGIS